MAFIVDSGFLVTSALPTDLKSVWDSTASLYPTSTIYPSGYVSASFRYISMEVYCRDDASTYKLIGGIADSNWVKIMTGSIYVSASYALNGGSGGGGATLQTGSYYPITSSWSDNATTASTSLTSSYFYSKYSTGAWHIYVNSTNGDLVFNYM